MLPEALGIPAELLVIFIVILSAVVLHTKSKSKQHAPPPPGPMTLPVIGNLHMLGNLPHRTLQGLATKYGPLMSLKLGQVPAIVISSPQIAELFLKTNHTAFYSRPKSLLSHYMPYGAKDFVFSEYGTYWRDMRKLCTLQLLVAPKVDMFSPLRRKEVEDLVKSVEKAASSHEAVDITSLVSQHIENITYKMILGRDKDDRFNVKKLVREVLNLAGTFNLGDYVPWLRAIDIQGLTRRLKRLGKAFDQVLEEIIKDHEQYFDNEGNGQRQKDFVDILLEHVHQPVNPQDEHSDIFDRDNIKAVVMALIIAGMDTSSSVVEWAMSLLLKHPEAMKKLQKELDNVAEMGRMVEESDLGKFPYLDMVVKETLRLYPVVPFLVPRECREDVTINGYHIKKKSRIMINAWAMGRDPKIWSDNVEEFYPERFVDDNVDMRGHDFRLIPFGSGRRGCPGIHLGLTTVKIVLAQLVHCFNWKLPMGMSPHDLDMKETFGLSMPRNQHLLAVPTSRLI